MSKPSDAASESSPRAPAHIEETTQSIADLQADHRENATPLQRAADRLTDFVGRPSFVAALAMMISGWIILNVMAGLFGFRSMDPPPFVWLESVCSLGSVYLVVLVLATQRREEQLAKRQALLALQMAMLNEQKTAKIIELLEELRRDSPVIPDRTDQKAEAMAKPADPRAILHAIEGDETSDLP